MDLPFVGGHVPPPACAPYEDCNGPLLQGDPLLDPSHSPPPGWYAAVEFGIVGPHIKNRLTAGVPLGTVTEQVQLPTADLDWTVAPRFEVGYRFAQGFGDLLVSYRTLRSEGRDTLVNFDLGDGLLRSRLDVNVIDLDYASREFSLGPCWDMKWKAGVRLANIFFDSRADGLILAERTSNHFFGAGPHAGLDLWRFIGTKGLAVFGRLEGAVAIGDIDQGFEEVVLTSNGTVLGGAANVHGVQAVPVLGVEAGVGWCPSGPGHWLRLAAGYQFERWWYVGTAGDSSAELTVQGVFLRAELAF
jgi:hypothetical protein